MRRQRGLVLVLCLAVAAVHLWLLRFTVTDDAFISFRYLAHWLAGEGLVYNPGEPVWGFSNFLWIVLLAPGVALGADPLVAARCIGAAATASILVALVLGVASSRGSARGNPGGALLLASTGAFAMQGFSGLETSLFTAWVLAAIAAHERAARVDSAWARAVPGVLASLATLTRPEGVFLFALLAGDAWLERGSGAAARRRLAGLGLGFAPVFLAFEVGMWSAYGALWPNSIDSKVGVSGEQLLRGLHYAATFARSYPVPCAVPLLAALAFRSASRGERLALRAAALFAALPIAVGGDWMPGYRLFHPFLLCSAILTPLAFERLRQTFAPLSRTAAGAALLVAACVLGASSTWRDPHVSIGREPDLLPAAIRVGRFLRDQLPSDSLLALNTAGTIPYYSGLRVVDMMGINDRAIARRRDLPPDWKGIEKGDGRYVLSRRPDYIQLGSFLGGRFPLFLSDLELYADEAFHRNYELLELRVDPETTLRLYRRRAAPRGPLSPAERARIDEIVARQWALSTYRY